MAPDDVYARKGRDVNKSTSTILLVCTIGWVLYATPLRAFVSGGDTTQTETPQTVYKYVSMSEAAASPAFGAGIGISYGLLGFRGGPEFARWSPCLGVGVVPIDWSLGITVSGTVFLTDRTKTVRPKITLAYSNAVAIAAVVVGDDIFDPAFSKTYSGLAGYFGIDWRITKRSTITLELGVGAVYPFEGIDQVNEDLKEAQERYLSQGYILEDTQEARSFPVFYLGLVYSPGRTMTLKKTQG
jgi:hypothetical protein